MDLLEIDEEDIKAFLIDSYENINDIERDIIALEKAPENQELLVRIYRCVHTIKGNCGFLAFPKLESVAHVSENLLGCLRESQLSINAGIINVLLQTVDAIRQILNNIETTGYEGEADYSELIKTLNQLQDAPTDGDRLYNEKDAPSEIELEITRDDAPQAVESSIRVNVGLLEQVMNLVGELVLARNQLVQYSATFEDTGFSAMCQHFNLISTELQQGVMKTRMQPISTLWQKIPRVARDLAISCGKQVQVEIEGGQTELDKTILEAIKDPLTHLVRNCIDHGIETKAVRTEVGKPPQGRLLLRAFHESGKVNIEISDDGAGIDLERVKHKAQQQKLITTEQAAQMNDREAIDLIFLPGFSTAKQVTNISGRGVGMDVVKNNIQKINGTVEVYSQPGHGTTFKIKIPLTLAIIPALIVTSFGDRYAIPQGNVQELVLIEGERASQGIEILYDVPVFRLRGNLLPLIYLNRELQLENSRVDTFDERIYIVVLQADGCQFGLVVDAIDDTQEIVIKPLGKQLKNISTFSGATILGDGKVALIIDVIALAHRARLTSQMQKSLSTMTHMQSSQGDCQMLLLFTGPLGGRMAIPLKSAVRLEEFPSTAVERVGNQYVVQYRGKILSLITLADVLSTYHHPRRPKKVHLTTDETIQVVVVSCDQENSIGLVVDSIQDIVEEELTIKGTATRPGVLFSAVVQGQVTEILDVENMFQSLTGIHTEQSLAHIT